VFKAESRGSRGRARGQPARIAGGRCMAGGAGRKKGRRRLGADRWGRGVRGREGESAGWADGEAGLMGRRGEGVGPGGPSVGRGKRKRKRLRVGLLSQLGRFGFFLFPGFSNSFSVSFLVFKLK
jgi:hypothetical protein